MQGNRVCFHKTKVQRLSPKNPGSHSDATQPASARQCAAPPKQRRGQVKEGPAGAEGGGGLAGVRQKKG